MKTILIAHSDQAFAEQLESQLRNGGYRVISCPDRGHQQSAAFGVTRATAHSLMART